MKSFTGDPGDHQEFVHNLKDIKVTYDISSHSVSSHVVKALGCVACDKVVKLPSYDIREAILCDDCKDVFKKMKKYV